MKSQILFISLISFVAGNAQKPLIISGQITNHENILPIEFNSELEPLAGYPPINVLIPDRSGKYSTTCTISEENYFKIGRNTVWLSPGSKIIANINYNWPDSSSFFGAHRPENNYLKSTPFPFGGSYLEGGDKVYSTLNATIDSVSKMASRRREELKKMAGVSEKFKEYERARIIADETNSFKYLINYYSAAKKLSGDELIQVQAYCNNHIKKHIESLPPDFFQSKYLRLEVYRNILPFLLAYGKFSDSELTKVQDWEYSGQLTRSMTTSEDRSQFDTFKKSLDSIRNGSYAKEVLKTYEYLKSLNGEDAYDFILTDFQGNKKSLSTFKGKLIVIDLWATWCGPCVQQMGALEKYKKSIQQNEDIIVLTISVDGNSRLWRDYLDKSNNYQNQFIVSRDLLAPYNVNEIPRTIIINKDFRIVAFRGPKIVAPDFEQQVLSMMNKE